MDREQRGMEIEGQREVQLEDEPLGTDERRAQARTSATEPGLVEGGPDERRRLISRSALFDKVGALVMIIDRQGRVVWCNRVIQETTGLSFEDVWGKHVWEVLALPEDADTVKGVLDNLRTGRFTRGYESHLLTEDGSVRVIQWSTAPLLDGDGPVEHIVGVGVDITERKWAEDALRKSEAHYRRLVESSTDAIFVHSKGNIVFVNRAGASLLGASNAGEIIGRPVLDFVPSGNRSVVKERLQKGLEHDTELALMEDGLVRLDGSEVRVDAHSIFPFMYQDRPSVQVVVREVDVTWKGEGELIDQQRMYDTLLRVCTDAVMATDLRGRITHVSRRTLELWGFEGTDDLIGGSTFELVAPEDHEEYIKSLQKTFREGVVSDIELTLLRKDGSRFDGRLDMALLRDVRGKPGGFIATAREVTPKKAPAGDLEAPHGEGEESTALLEASRAVLRYRDFESAARAIFTSCQNLVGAGAGYLGLMNEDATTDDILFSEPLEFSWATGLARSRPMRELRAEAYLTGEAMYLNELAPGEGALPEAEDQPSVDSILFAPLSVGENTVGLLGFANKVGGFTEADARMASAFGQLAAVSLESSRALEALELSEEQLRSVTETTGDAIVTLDGDEHIVSWNPGAEAIFGYSGEEMIGKRLTLVAPGDLRDAYKKAVHEVESSGDSSTLEKPAEMIGRRKDGSTFPLELSFAGWRTRKGVFLTCTIRDITERRLVEHDLRLLADHDHLTGLPNRALFRDRLTQALASANREPQRMGVMMIDLDHFKAINHELGPQAGDQLLQSVGDRLAGLVRADDTVARSGDDEFALLLLGMGEPTHASAVAKRMLQALRVPFALNGREVRITASIGVALYPEDGTDIDTLMKRADIALCQVKAQGRDSYQRFVPIGDRETPDQSLTRGPHQKTPSGARA